MKIFKSILFAAAMLAAAINTNAQRAWDVFAVTRQATLFGPTNITATGTSSNIIDVLPFTGIGKVTILCTTNTGTATGTMSFALYGSNDRTNWTAITSLAYVTNTTSVSYTNSAYGTSGTLYGTNFYLLPGSITYPVVATAGFSTSYLNPVQFTNSSAITVAATASSIEIGVNWDSVPRYMSLQSTCATTANFTIAATVDGYIKSY